MNMAFLDKTNTVYDLLNSIGNGDSYFIDFNSWTNHSIENIFKDLESLFLSRKENFDSVKTKPLIIVINNIESNENEYFTNLLKDIARTGRAFNVRVIINSSSFAAHNVDSQLLRDIQTKICVNPNDFSDLEKVNL